MGHDAMGKKGLLYTLSVIGFLGATSSVHAAEPKVQASFKQAKTITSNKVFNLPKIRTVTANKRSHTRSVRAAKNQIRHAAKVAPVKGILKTAGRFVGWKYRYGGATPKTSFDCSGLVQYAYRKGANVSVPRTAASQFKASTRIPQRIAQPGDLVFFNTLGRRVSHVGLYLGKNRFLHAPRTGKRIQVSRIKGYWKRKLIGFGRIPGACRLPAAYTRSI